MARLGIFDKALETIPGIKSEYRHVSALEAILQTCKEMGPSAISILGETLKLVYGVKDEFYRMEDIMTIAEACTEIGPEALPILEGLLELTRGMNDKYCCCSALLSIAQAYNALGKEYESVQVLKEVLEITSRIKNEWERFIFIHDSTTICVKIGPSTLGI